MGKTDPVFGIAIVGCGTVGARVANLLVNSKDILTAKVSAHCELRAIVDIDFSRAEQLLLDSKLYTKDFKGILVSPDIQIVIELVGGTTIAKDIIAKALTAGKHVVTANKALIAQAGNELLALAREHKVCLLFEASCAGGIPIIRALYDGLVANRIDALFGIVNGTCNYILTQMSQLGKSYAEALAEAQAKGYAEKDPTLDVSGLDSAHKLAILSAIAFGQKIDLASVGVEGIDTLDLADVLYGQELGYVLKLLAIAKREDGGIYQAVKPAFISREHPLAWISGPFNAVSVYGHAAGHTMYYGRGAGGDPTASAVLSDVIALAQGTAQKNFENLKLWPDRASAQLERKEARSRFYIRMMASDEPGVLAQIATIFGQHGISISSVLQKELADGQNAAKGVPVVLTTHPALESAIKAALARVDALDVISGTSICISILDEHQEYL